MRRETLLRVYWVYIEEIIMKTVLHAEKIRKSFSGNEVLHNVDFTLMSGEIHALVGENGAGKSTLMKIFMGEYRPDSGIISINGKLENIQTPAQALSLGISMVHQELHYMPYLSIADYMYLGREPRNIFFLNRAKKIELTLEQLNNIGLEINPDNKMGQLTVSELQMIEIAKVISYGTKILILDEPTSSISETEVERLFEILKFLKSKGVSVIYISHRLEELNRIADTVTILRDGYRVITDKLSNLGRDKIINKMVGRKIEEIFPKRNMEFKDIFIEVKGLTKKDEFEDINISVKKGEVVGLAGLVGAGRTEVVTSIFGEKKVDKGHIYINGKQVKIDNAISAVKKRIAFVTEDRKLSGLNLIGSVKDNISSVILKETSQFGLLKLKEINKKVISMIEKLKIKINTDEQLVSSLSGGNQQKIVLSKWLLIQPDLFILDEPTRGIDVGAKIEVYKLIHELAVNGKAIILISSELPEIVSLCNRVYVLHEGKITGELTGNEITQEAIMNYASG